VRLLAIIAVLTLASSALGLPPGARPLETRITPEHPLVILYGPGNPEALVRNYQALEPDIKPYCMIHAEERYPAADSLAGFRRLLGAAQHHGIPLVFQIAGPDESFDFPLEVVESLLREFSTIKGIMMVETSFNDYSHFGGGIPYALRHNARYGIDAIKLAARHGKFFTCQLAHANFLYIMAGELNRPLYDTFRQYRDYVIPQHEMNVPFGMHQAHTAPLGMWLEGAVGNWGIEPQSWYWADAEYADPEDFTHGDIAKMPPAVYRQMILTGVTAGATVYSFEPPDDLVGGSRSHHWREAIYPTMMEVIRNRLIPTRDQVLRKIRVAYQLAPASTPAEMHRNLRDVNEILDQGNLIRGTYGVYDQGLEYEFIPNTGRYYWIPLLSPSASRQALGRFTSVIRPGQFQAPEQFRAHCNRFYRGDGQGTACIMSIGRATYVMQTHENLYQEQTFTISVPTRPSGLQARATPGGIALTWHRHQGDKSYTVWRRIPGRDFEPIPPRPLTDTGYLDAHVPPGPVWYAVSAVTTARETIAGTVNLHDALVFSNVESPLSAPVALPGGDLPPPAADTRPKHPGLDNRLDGLAPEQRAVGAQVAGRVQQWKQAILAQDLPAVLDTYSRDYRDPDGYTFESVERSFQWFFRRYQHPFGRVVILRWNFSRWRGEGLVGVHVYAVLRASSVAEENPDDLVHFPRDRAQGTMLWWRKEADGAWRLVNTDPSLPSLDELLIYST